MEKEKANRENGGRSQKCPLRIFLCHYSNDKPAVRELYNRLRADGFDPWLDEENLLPGQDWQQEIRKAVPASDVVIVCLSRGVITKAGFIQKEIKFALDVADELPEGTIFIIPLKLEECDVPERLKRWQWAELFKENGYERLLQALHQCRPRGEAQAQGIQPTPEKKILQTQTLKDGTVVSRTTAISILDRALGGGLPSGSVVYIKADAESMAEVFLYQFTQARKTYFFSTERQPKHVIHDIKNYGFKIDNITFIDINSEYYINDRGELLDNVGNEFMDAKIINFAEYHLKKIMLEGEDDINVIFDSFSFYLNLNVNPGLIKRFIKSIYDMTKSLNCLSFLYGLRDAHKENLENEILKLCDVIFRVELEVMANKISNRLSIPKLRGRVPTNQVLKFKVGNAVDFDTTIDIT